MGRKENPVVRDVPAVGRLADFQRAWRATAGLTYEDLAHATGWSAATLRNAASGRRPPRRDVGGTPSPTAPDPIRRPSTCGGRPATTSG